MATAKVNGLLFEGWWKERVIVEPGAFVRFDELYADYRKHCHAGGMGRQAFIRRLNGLKIRETKRKDVRWRAGCRLRTEAERAEGELAAAAHFSTYPGYKRGGTVTLFGAEAAAKIAEDAATKLRAGMADAVKAAFDRADGANLKPHADDGRYSTVSLAGGAVPVVSYMLDAPTPEDEASARVAREIYLGRLRQRKPTDDGGEGFSNAEDDKYGGQLAFAASAYAYAAGQPEGLRAFVMLNGKPVRSGLFGGHVVDVLRMLWPWDIAWWKPKTPREDLVRAGALILAAIEKIDRAEARQRADAEEARLTMGV